MGIQVAMLHKKYFIKYGNKIPTTQKKEKLKKLKQIHLEFNEPWIDKVLYRVCEYIDFFSL